MSLLIDVIVIIAFAASFIAGIKRGFIKSVMGIVVVVAAIIGSVHLSPPLANYINDKFVEKNVVRIAEDAIDGIVNDNLTVDKLLSEQPKAFTDILDRFGVKAEDMIGIFDGNEGASDNEKVAMMAHKIGAPISVTVSKAIAFITTYLALYIALLIVSFIICGIAKLPVIRTANKLLGGILGAAAGIILAWGLSVALCALMPHLAMLYEDIPQNVIDHSIVVKFLGGIDPTSLIK